MSWVEAVVLAIHIVSRMLVAVAMTVGLHCFRSSLNAYERLGMGMMGGGALMTVPIIADLNGTGTPFDIWSPSIMSVGILVFFGARCVRIIRHARANDLARSEAAAYLANRGK